MAENQPLDKLRDMLKAKPTKALWEALCEKLDDWKDLDELEDKIIPELEDDLGQWPMALRITPEYWVERLLEGDYVPQISISRVLDLRCRSLELEDAELLGESPELKYIRHLNLAYNGLDDQGTRVLVQSEFISNLEILDLAGNSVGVHGVDAICKSEYLESLRHLDLTGNWVDIQAANLLASTESLPKLEVLVLRGNPLRTAGMKILADSEHLHDAIKCVWQEEIAQISSFGRDDHEDTVDLSLNNSEQE